MERMRMLLLTFIVVFVLGIIVVMLLVVPPAKSPDIESDENRVQSSATAEAIEIEILESFPVQINAVVTGQLANGCTTIDSAITNLVDNTFIIELVATQPKDTDCTQAQKSFSEKVPLEINGLSKGDYNVQIDAVVTSFTLETDNFITQDIINSDTEHITLNAVNGFTANGEATRLMDEQGYTHTVQAQLPEITDDTFYEGWLVRPEPNFDFISTGELDSTEGEYSLSYTSEQDLSDYTQVIITQETKANGLDNNPEIHVLEGSF